MVLGLHGIDTGLGQVLQAQTHAMKQFREISTANDYLNEDKIWKKMTGYKRNPKTGKMEEDRIEKLDHVKGLVPIEIKVVKLCTDTHLS